jgi:glycosyltransferase involved in cell wall biosynthesis
MRLNVDKIHITVVMASYLGNYTGAATWRDLKIRRAIDSYINQRGDNFTSELIVISDGCQQTVDIVKQYGTAVKLLSMDKQPIWAGAVRAAGIQAAKPGYICYLDVDDKLGENHLSILAAGLQGKQLEWAFFNNNVLDVYHKPTEQNNSLQRARCGTCNIVHLNTIDKLWNVKPDYLHDWNAIQYLVKNYHKYETIATPEYIVCHLPKMLDV